MARNKLSRKFKALPDKNKWLELCPQNEYRVFSFQDALNEGIVPTGMTDINSVIVGASGFTESTIMFFANYCRVDGICIDQEPYIELYENGNSIPSINGILHHADFDGRTEILSQNDINRIAASGTTVNVQFTAKPDNISGKLEELKIQGKIEGFNYALRQGISKK